MTLEGEYYFIISLINTIFVLSQSSWHWKANITNIQLAEDIKDMSQSSWHWKANITETVQKLCDSFYLVAILMTLEGEYYEISFNASALLVTVAILMTLEGEYYPTK